MALQIMLFLLTIPGAHGVFMLGCLGWCLIPEAKIRGGGEAEGVGGQALVFAKLFNVREEGALSQVRWKPW